MACAETLWSDDVYAGGHTVTTPLSAISVEAGTILNISADVEDKWRIFGDFYPAMFQWTNADGLSSMSYEDFPYGSLVGRIGDTGDWFLIGTGFHHTMEESGTLYLACWDDPDQYSDNEDMIHVVISRDEAFHPADFDRDNDVDGRDLATYAGDTSVLDIQEFTNGFGTVKITNNASLDNMTVSTGKLTPSFSTDRTDYVLTINNATSEILITATAEDPLAVITIGGVEVDSGTAYPVDLDTGNTFIPIEVTSQDNTVVKTYTILAHRDGNAALSALNLPYCNLNPPFSPEISVYNTQVESAVQSIEIIPATDVPGSLITVNGHTVPSGNSEEVSLTDGINEITVIVTADDGSTRTITVFVRKIEMTSKTAYVVDTANADNEFETLTGAINYLNSSLLNDEIGEIRIQTTHPMEVDELNITRNILIIVEDGASNVISGPADRPLVISASGGFDISGLAFVNSPGYTINTSNGLSVVGSAFSGDTTVNISGISAMNAKGSGTFNNRFEFLSGTLSGYLNINLMGNADYNFRTAGNNAAGIFFDASGSFTGDAGLIFKANQVSGLNITASLRDNAKAQITGHTGLTVSRLGLDFEENGAVFLENNIIGTLIADFHGLQGTFNFKNVTTASALLNVGTANSTYTGDGNTFTEGHVSLVYNANLTSFGFTEKGGFVRKLFQINAQDAPTNFQFVVGMDDMAIDGNLNIFAGGKARITMNNNTVLKLDAFIKCSGSLADLDFSDFQGKANVALQFPSSGIEVYLQAQRSHFDRGLTVDTATDTLNARFDTVQTLTAGIRIGHDLLSGPDGSKGATEYSSDTSTPMAKADGDNSLVFTNLDIKDTGGQPGLYIQGVKVPVTISNSTINADLWSIVCADVDGEVKIEGNSSLIGGIMLDGDSEMAGNMIGSPYTVQNNTITQNRAGGACLSSHAISNITVTGNNMTASTPGAHGITLSGGRMEVNGGKIITPGPYVSNAIGLGPSAGGANAILHAADVNPITGGVVPQNQGYVRLTNNTFSNAKIFDLLENARLLNDPVADNTGLDPDEDIVGSLIDWNNDTHNCPDYPTRCDKWDEDQHQCGCGQDGVDPPSEP